MAPLPRKSPRNHPPSTVPRPVSRRKQNVSKKSNARSSQASAPGRSKAPAGPVPEDQTTLRDPAQDPPRSQPPTETAPETNASNATGSKKRSAPDVDPTDQLLDTPPTFKRIRLSWGDYHTPLQDGAHYNEVSPAAMAVRHLADQTAISNLRETVLHLTQHNELQPSQEDSGDHTQEELLESNLERAELRRQLLEVQTEKQHIEQEARTIMEQNQAKDDELELARNEIEQGKNAIAALESRRQESDAEGQRLDTQNADLQRALQAETNTRLQAEEERDAALNKVNEQHNPTRDASTEFDLNEQVTTLTSSNEQLQAALQEARSTSEKSERMRGLAEARIKRLEAEVAALSPLKAEYERWRGQTVPPTVVPRGQLTAPPVNANQGSDTQPAQDSEDESSEDSSDDETGQADNRLTAEECASNLQSLLDERATWHEEFMTAQTDFEEGRHDRLAFDKVFHDFREENWVRFSKSKDGRIRRDAVYAAQLDPANTSTHILRFPPDKYLTRRSKRLYVTSCLTAQDPEVQGEAARDVFSEDEYSAFMKRSFGPDWMRLDRSHPQAEADARQQAIKELRRDKRFRTACKMWAAGEPALNQDRCWPPTFLSMEKTQACTHFSDEEERTRIEMSSLPGTGRETVKPFHIDEPSEEQLG